MRIRSFFKKWWFWVLLVIIIGIIFAFTRPGEKIIYVTEEVTLMLLEQTVDVSGEVESINEVQLAFDVGGELAEVHVEIGQEVEAETVLATLDTTELVADVQSAYQAVQIARANLAQQKAGVQDETIEVSNASVGSAKATMAQVKKDFDNATLLLGVTQDRYAADIDSKQRAVTTAKANLSQTKVAITQTLSDAYRDLFSAAWAAIISARAGFTQSDDVLGLRNGFANNEFRTGLSARNPGALEKANSAFYTAEISIGFAEASMVFLSYGSSYASIHAAALKVQNSATDVSRLLLHTKVVTDATLNAAGFTVADHTTLKANVNAARSTLQTNQAALQNAFQTVENGLDDVAADLGDSNNALQEAFGSLYATTALGAQQVLSAENFVSSLAATLVIRQADLSKAVASLSETVATPRQIDLASYQAEVARTGAAYQASQARLGKAQIISPIKGSVTLINFEVGETVSASTFVITVQTTETQFKIVADVSESDIAKVEIDDRVELTFDAFTDDVVIRGRVGEIDPAEKLIEGVVYYRATIFLEELQIVLLRPGMSSDLVIHTDAKESVISVPQRAVIEREGKRYVRVLVGDHPEEREVTTGLRGDLGRIEIVTGLTEGDQVILREKHE